MAESLTVTMTAPFADGRQDNKITLSWTSAADGSVSQSVCDNFNSGQPQYQFGTRPSKITGYIVRAVTNPDDSDAPTDDYDITLLDEDGVDVMGGNLIDRDTSDSEQVTPSSPPYIDSDLTLTVASAGDTKKGVLTLYMVSNI